MVKPFRDEITRLARRGRRMPDEIERRARAERTHLIIAKAAQVTPDPLHDVPAAQCAAFAAHRR
jgi:hypothetical protein